MPCQRWRHSGPQIAATTGATSLQFGAVSDAALQNFSLPVTPVATPVVSISLLGIPIRANIAGTTNVASSGPTTLSFTQAEIDAGTVKSAPYASATPFNTLSTNLSLSTTILGNPGHTRGRVERSAFKPFGGVESRGRQSCEPSGPARERLDDVAGPSTGDHRCQGLRCTLPHTDPRWDSHANEAARSDGKRAMDAWVIPGICG